MWLSFPSQPHPHTFLTSQFPYLNTKTNFQITSQLIHSQNLHLHLSASKCPKFLLQIRVHKISFLFIFTLHGILLRQLSVHSFSSIDSLAQNRAEESAESANFEFGFDHWKRRGCEAVAAA